MVILYRAKKKSGKAEDKRIELNVPFAIRKKLSKDTINKEQLLLVSLVDCLAKMEGYEAGYWIGEED
jgi:hypothetical protein